MSAGWKAAAALGAVAAVVGAPVAFVVQGAGAPGRPDSVELWWERLRRLPEPMLQPPARASAVRAGGEKVERVQAEARAVEARAVPSQSPVVAIAELGELVAVATFDDGAFAVERDGTVHRVEGVAAVNALAFDAEGNLCIASDDGAYVAAPGERARRVARGAFSAVASIDGAVWFASRGGVARLDEGGLTRWGADQGLSAEQPTSIARCGESICLGAVDGLRELTLGARAGAGSAGEAAETRARVASAASVAPASLPTELVTAIASGAGATWAGTFDGGLVRLGAAPLTPADGLPEGRIAPRALAVVGDQAYAGTPSGLLVARERSAALVPVGGEVSAVAASIHGGVWVGLTGRVIRMEVAELPVVPSDPTTLAQSRIP